MSALPLADLLRGARTIAVVGCSPRPGRDSHRIAAYLIEAGYEVIPVNPSAGAVLGRKCYPGLRAVPFPVDIVDVFRRSEEVPPIVEDAIARGARAVWMQIGIFHEDAARRAREAGLAVVMDRCILVEHAGLRRQGLL